MCGQCATLARGRVCWSREEALSVAQNLRRHFWEDAFEHVYDGEPGLSAAELSLEPRWESQPAPSCLPELWERLSKPKMTLDN